MDVLNTADGTVPLYAVIGERLTAAAHAFGNLIHAA
jgi:hypothetical protein